MNPSTSMPDHGSGSHGSGSHGGGGGGHMMMSMSFHFGTNETILFDFWQTTGVVSLVYSCVIIFVLATLYEGMKYFREGLYRWNSKRSAKKVLITTSNGSTEALQIRETDLTCSQAMFSPTHGVQTLLHALQFFVSYLLMLIFMTYNVWLCLAVILGAAVGFFFFGWKKTAVVDITEHCH